MPRPGDIDTSYPVKLRDIGIELQEPFVGAKVHHQMKCMSCGHGWSATPISKLQNHKKWGKGGCPLCTHKVREALMCDKRTQNLHTLQERGLEVISDYNGQYVKNIPGESVPLDVTVKNTTCGHTFTASSKNLLTRGVVCPVCAREYKNSVLAASSKSRSEEWQKTASEWKLYKSTATKLTRTAYNQNKAIINPNDLPTGRAGTDGAYHIDHIVPIRYCFDNNIPADVCAHHTNLQMLGWRENVGSRDKLKEGCDVPAIFSSYIR